MSDIHNRIREEAKRDAAAWNNPGGRACSLLLLPLPRLPVPCQALEHAPLPQRPSHLHSLLPPTQPRAPAGDPDRGYQQLISEQLPLRRDQLYGQYGPGGAIPLVPGERARARRARRLARQAGRWGAAA